MEVSGISSTKEFSLQEALCPQNWNSYFIGVKLGCALEFSSGRQMPFSKERKSRSTRCSRLRFHMHANQNNVTQLMRMRHARGEGYADTQSDF